MTSLTANSGTPLTALVLGNRSDAGGSGVVGSARADATGSAVNSGGGYFNTDAFALPAADQYGNAARNTIPGRISSSSTHRLNRTIPIAGRAHWKCAPRPTTFSTL